MEVGGAPGRPGLDAARDAWAGDWLDAAGGPDAWANKHRFMDSWIAASQPAQHGCIFEHHHHLWSVGIS